MQTTKKSAPKRLLSILLTICLAAMLLPVFTLPANAVSPVNPTGSATWDFTTATEDGSGTDAGTGTWDWVNSTKTLTLTGITHSTTAAPALLVPQNTTIILVGTNTITSTYSGAGYAPGLAFDTASDEATITGTGTLTVKGGDSTDSFSCGIYAQNSIVISGATVTATGGDNLANNSAGLWVQSGSIRIIDSADVTATGGHVSAGGTTHSSGTRSTGDVTISGGAYLKATGGTSAFGTTSKWGVNLMTSGGALEIVGGKLLAIGVTRAISSDYIVPSGYPYTVSTDTSGSPATSGTGDGTFTVGSTHMYASIEPPALTPVTFTAAETGGAYDTADSTGIVLTFSAAVTGLAIWDVTITNGTGGAVKGTGMSGSGPTWTIPLSSVTAQGTVAVSVGNFGTFNVTTVSQTVTVYRAKTYTVDVTSPAVASGETFTFTGAMAGYSPSSPTSFTITNTGTEDMTNLDVDLTGADAGSFTLDAGSVTATLASGSTTTFSIKPNDGLAEGTYTATVTITDTNITDDYTFDISFTVKAGSSGGVVSGGSGGGGGGAGGAGAPPATATIPAGDGTVSVTYSISGGVATLTMPTAKVNEIIGKAEDGTAVLDLSKVTNATAAVIPKAALTGLADAELAVEIMLSQGTVTFDNDAATSIAKQAGGTNVTVSLSQVNQTTLTAAQKEAVKPGDLVFNISVMSSSQVITNFDGTITVAIPYSGPLPVAVWYLNAAGELEKLASVYDSTTKTVSFVTNHLSLYVVGLTDPEPITPAMPVNPFSDVFGTDWFIDDVIYAYSIGLINGVTPTTFAPNSNLTYAEAVKLAACMHQLYTTGAVTLTNASPVWYESYVKYAKDNGIIDKDYDWGAPATRAGYIEIFANALPDEAFEEINDFPDDAIPDVDMDHPQAAAIYKLYRAGILQGVDDDYNCSPDSNIRRSEVAAILTRMMNPDARIEFNGG